MPIQNNNKSSLKNKILETTIIPAPAKDLFAWQAPARPFKKRDKEYFSTIAAIVLLLTIILLFIKEWLLVGVIIAFMFVAYVLATVPPLKVSYKITTRGIVVNDKIYKWSQLSRFWFSKKWDSQIIHFESLNTFPWQLQLVLENNTKEKVRKVVEKYLIFDKPKKRMIDKMANWLEKTVPLESK